MKDVGWMELCVFIPTILPFLPCLYTFLHAIPTSLLIFTDFFFIFLPFLLAYVTQITSGLTFSDQLKLSIIYSGSTTLQVLHSLFLVNVSVLA